MPITGDTHESSLILRIFNDDDPIGQTGLYCHDEDCPCEGDLVFWIDSDFCPAEITDAATQHVLKQKEKQDAPQL